MVCISFPTCLLAIAETERILSSFIKKIENIMIKYKIEKRNNNHLCFWMLNVCVKILLAEVGLMRKSLNRYNLHIEGNRIRSRILKIYKEKITEKDALIHLKNLIKT